MFTYSFGNTQSPSGPTGTRENLGRLQEKTESEIFDPRKHKDTKRAHIAFVFVYGYVILVALIIILVPLYNWLALAKPTELDIEKILAQTGALLGAPLGFVVGYYFKEDKD